MDKKLPNIEVLTQPNGYSLKFDGMRQRGYFYFSPDTLLQGFMLHIGLGITDQLNTETMNDFIVTAMNWKDNEKCIKEIERLTASLKTAEKAVEAAECRLTAKQERIDEFCEKLLALAKKHDIKKDVEKLIATSSLKSKIALAKAEDDENEEDDV